jgi:hypothetical protein
MLSAISLEDGVRHSRLSAKVVKCTESGSRYPSLPSAWCLLLEVAALRQKPVTLKGRRHRLQNRTR